MTDRTRHPMAMVLAIFLGAWLATAAYGAPSKIVPGIRIGKLVLKSYTGSLPLGKPDLFDGAASHYGYLWVSNNLQPNGLPVNTLIARAVSNGPTGGIGITMQGIRVTSPFFHTDNGIRTGKKLSQIRHRFSQIVLSTSYPGIEVDQTQGIAFEFASPTPSPSSRCTAISVFPPGGGVITDAQVANSLIAEWKSTHP